MRQSDVRNSEPTDRGLDPTDSALLELLRKDARRSNVELASRLGVSEKTVRNRISRLLGRGLVFRAEFPREKPPHRLVYLLRSRPGRRFALAENLRSHPAITRLYVTNGSADLVVTCDFDSEADSLRFENEVLEPHPDVQDVQVCSSVTEIPRLEHETVASLRSGQLELDDEQIARSLILMPRFRDQPEAMHWLGGFLRRVYSADHVLVSTNLESLGAAQGPLTPYTAAVNLPSYYSDLSGERIVPFTSKSYPHLPIHLTLNSRKHVFIPDVAASRLLSPMREIIAEVGYVSLLTFPMNYGSEIVGVVALYYDTRLEPSTGYISSLQRSIDFFTVTLLHSLPSEATP